MFDRRATPLNGAGRDVLHNRRTSGDLNAVAELDVVPYSNATTEHHMATESRGPADGGVCDDDAVARDLDVVPDLHVVVDFRAAADSSDAAAGAVDGGVCTDFDVILDDHRADLGNLAIRAAALQIAEAIAADRRIGVYDHALAECAALAQHHVGPQQAVATHARVAADVHAGVNLSAGRDDRPRSDIRVRPDRGAVDNRVGGYNRCRVNTDRHVLERRRQPRQHFANGEIGISDAYRGLPGGHITFLGDYDDLGVRVGEARGQLYAADPREGSLAGFLERGDGPHRRRGVADQFAGESFGKFPCRKRRSVMHRPSPLPGGPNGGEL